MCVSWKSAARSFQLYLGIYICVRKYEADEECVAQKGETIDKSTSWEAGS